MLDAIDDLLDELVPGELDWRRLVQSYPLPALLLAAAGGFWLGRTRGPQVLTAVTGFASAEIAKGVTQLMDQAG
jgi:D-serine deaminase-like pyridoxal phosphate-dependent protein